MLINMDSRQHNDNNVYHLKHKTITTLCIVIQSKSIKHNYYNTEQ